MGKVAHKFKSKDEANIKSFSFSLSGQASHRSFQVIESHKEEKIERSHAHGK